MFFVCLSCEVHKQCVEHQVSAAEIANSLIGLDSVCMAGQVHCLQALACMHGRAIQIAWKGGVTHAADAAYANPKPFLFTQVGAAAAVRCRV